MACAEMLYYSYADKQYKGKMQLYCTVSKMTAAGSMSQLLTWNSIFQF